VPVILVTGMSGTGKSAVLAELARRGHRVVDTDYGSWGEDVALPDAPGSERRWREDRIEALLDGHSQGTLFVSGCVSNQGRFYPRFEAVVLLSAPLDVILERVMRRETNDYGKTDAQRDEIAHYVATVEPLLRAGATAEIDARKPLDEVANELESIAHASG
jgi:dephospho-CoA kinase